jgi:hypothetical protein
LFAARTNLLTVSVSSGNSILFDCRRRRGCAHSSPKPPFPHYFLSGRIPRRAQHQPTNLLDYPDSWQLASGRRRKKLPQGGASPLFFRTQDYLRRGGRGRQRDLNATRRMKPINTRTWTVVQFLQSILYRWSSHWHRRSAPRTPSRPQRPVDLYSPFLDGRAAINSDSFNDPHALFDGPDNEFIYSREPKLHPQINPNRLNCLLHLY